MTRKFWTDEKHDRLEMLYSVMGMDLNDIARDLGCTPRAAFGQITIIGLRLSPQAMQARKARGIPTRGFPGSGHHPQAYCVQGGRKTC